MTHGPASITGKRAWTTYLGECPIPFDVVHRNERTPDVAEASDGRMPCVLAEVDDALVLVLGPAQLETLSGDVGRFAAALDAALSSAGLSV